jgi:CubicO group peptidase (beta-lactamase class C family)
MTAHRYHRPVPDTVDQFFPSTPELGRTDALLVLQEGQPVIESYGPGIGPDTTLPSWSMAKSILHAAVGILVEAGTLDLDEPAPVSAWADADDPRRGITIGHLMTMRAGLAWTEEPTGGRLPDVVTMLYGNDRGPMVDTAAWAADRPLSHPPGSFMQYSSGSSAIVSGIVRDAVGSGSAYDARLRATSASTSSSSHLSTWSWCASARHRPGTAPT